MTAAVHTAQRAIVHVTRGTKHGPVTRLVSPGDLGKLLKPFVFLDLVDLQAGVALQGFGLHPHSGIATVTFLTSGDVSYEDTTGKKGVLPAGGVEWMRAGNGVWHTGSPVEGSGLRGFQLWLALPESQENAPAQSLYIEPSSVPREGAARVILGSWGAARSEIPAPAGVNYLAVDLKDGEHWRYVPPSDHTVAWVAVQAGALAAGVPVAAGELAVFEESVEPIDFVARGDASFVLGSARKHPHRLVMGAYSVHTSESALRRGEAEIQRIGRELVEAGRIG